MWASIGFRRTLKTVANFPAIILTPAFSYWVFGPVEVFSCQSWCRGGNSNLGVSFTHTWINVGLTVLGQIIFAILWSWHDDNLIIFAIYALPLHILSIIMLILLQCLEKCNCSKCCTTGCCASITQRTLLNVDNPLEKIEFQQTTNEEHEMQIQIQIWHCYW